MGSAQDGSSIRLRDLAENYTRQFMNYRGYSIGSWLRSSYDEEVFVNTHSFLVELCAARDHLAQYVAKTRFNGLKVDSMARLRDVLQRTPPMNDAVGKLILKITDSSAQKGWMARLSRYRNIIVHQNPLPALKGADAADCKDLPLATGQIMKSISIYIPDDPCDIHNKAKCDLLDRCADMLANMQVSRDNPRNAFDATSPWDELNVAYFSSYATWNYLTQPFTYTLPGFVTAEVDPRIENGETWRALKITYPTNVAGHSREQTSYFGNDGLLRRHDYTVDILGGATGANYPSDYREVSGIMVPAKRRIYARDAKGNQVLEPLLVSIDIAEISFN
jgi:hypothetical protein